ncbi:uncharacterized protein LOC133305853 [Gastrolobium bilobum]|uniref:uncharacterized protein LOC133305853 n=1 Tax=Gastrolobium bilobum TaxID=150636 RepID=UPI002AB05D3C|nr:uncharacterized protein LOC133305853 [Gastrolobium bilobum]
MILWGTKATYGMPCGNRRAHDKFFDVEGHALYRLLTRSRVAQWDGGDDICLICKNERETIIHAIRDCVQFGISRMKYGATMVPVHVRETMVQNLIKEVDEATNYLRSRSEDRRTMIINVAWQFPQARVIKMNTNGAAKGNLGLTAYGGLMRDTHGNWLSGFGFKFGICSSFKAEFWGVLRGLELLWNVGYQNVIIESDSSSLITVLISPGVAVREGQLVFRIRT